MGATLVFEIDMHELALRIGEAAIQIKRSPGKTPAEVMAEVRKVDAFMADGFYRAAKAAAEYMKEVVTLQAKSAQVQ